MLTFCLVIQSYLSNATIYFFKSTLSMRKLLLLCSMLLAGFTAGAQCVASFSSAMAPLNNALLRVQFNNTSSWGLPFTGQKRTAVINYGDGNTAAIGTTSPSHTYSFAGTYTVGIRIYSID